MNKRASEKISRPAGIVHKSGLQLASDHQAATSACPSVSSENRILQSRRKKQQRLFASSLFLLLGLLIVAGQLVSKPRVMASSKSMIKSDRSPASLAK